MSDLSIAAYETLHETKSHYDTDFSYNTYLCTIPQDFSEVPLHWHNETELIYIKKGKGIVSVDMKYYDVESGDLVVVCPGRIHSICNRNDSRLEYENIIFNEKILMPADCDRHTSEFFRHLNNYNNLFPVILKKTDLRYREIIANIDEADRVCETFPAWYELKIRSCLYNFFFTLQNHADDIQNHAENRLSDEKMEKLKIILNYVSENYNHAITIQNIADECHFSESHFMKFFKQCTGTSFISYLNDYRLIKASGLITSTDMKIIQIACECGFDNLSYFNRCFKKKYGVSPSCFR